MYNVSKWGVLYPVTLWLVYHRYINKSIVFTFFSASDTGDLQQITDADYQQEGGPDTNGECQA